VCLLVPVLIVLAVVLISPHVSRTLAIAQTTFFLLSLLAFSVSATLAHYVSSD
jgi:hypothetical protein